jgi:hypothetical protein
MNRLVEFARQQNPSDQRTDDAITLEYARQYGPDKLTDYEGFSSDYNRILGQMYPPTVGDYAKKVAGGFAAGTLNTLATIPEGVAVMARGLGQEAGGGAGQPAQAIDPGISDLGLRSLARAVQPEPVPGIESQYWDLIPQAAGSSLGFMLGAGALGKLGVKPLPAVAGLGAVAQGVQGYEDAVSHGATEGQAMKGTFLNALAGTSEAVPIAGWLERINKATGGTMAKALKDAVIEMGEEWTQETFQQWFQNAVANGIVKYDPERKWHEGVVPNGVAGAFTGFFYSMLSSALGARHGAHPPGTPGPETVQPPGSPGPARVAPLAPGTIPAGAVETKYFDRFMRDQSWAQDSVRLMGIKDRVTSPGPEGVSIEDRNALATLLNPNDPLGLERQNFYAMYTPRARTTAPPAETPPASPAAPVVASIAQAVSPAPIPVPVQQAPTEAVASSSIAPAASVPGAGTSTVLPEEVIQNGVQGQIQGQGPQVAVPTTPVPMVAPGPSLVASANEFIPPIKGVPGNPIGQVMGVLVYEGKEAAQALRQMYGLPNAIPRQVGQSSVLNPFGKTDVLFVDDSANGKPVAYVRNPSASKVLPDPMVSAARAREAAIRADLGLAQAVPAAPDAVVATPSPFTAVLKPDAALVSKVSFTEPTTKPTSARQPVHFGFQEFSPTESTVTVRDVLFRQNLKGRKLGVFESADGQHVLVASALVNRTGDSILGVQPGGKIGGVSLSKLVMGTNLGGLGYKPIGAIVNSTKEKIAAVYNRAEWENIAQQLRAKSAEALASTPSVPTGQAAEVKGPGVTIGSRAQLEVAPRAFTSESAGALYQAIGIDKPLDVPGFTSQEIQAGISDALESKPALAEVIANAFLQKYGDKKQALVNGVKHIQYAYEKTIEAVESGKLPATPEAFEAGVRYALERPERGATYTEPGGSAGVGQTGSAVDQNARPSDATRHTYSGSEGLPGRSADITQRFQDLLDTASDAGLIVQMHQAATQEGTYRKGVIEMALVDASKPTTNSMRILLHELAHHVYGQENAAIQEAIHAAVDSFSNAQLGIEGTSDSRVLSGPEAFQAGLEAQGLSPTAAALSAPSVQVEERLAEHLALQNMDRPTARGIAANIIRALKDLYYRGAMALQKFWGRAPSESLAMKYIENRFAGFINGQRSMNLFEFLVPPLPRAVQAEVQTPVSEVGFIPERALPDGTIEYGNTVEDLSNILRYTKNELKPGVPADRNVMVENAKIALANREIKVQSSVLGVVKSMADVRDFLEGADPLKWIRSALGLPNPDAIKQASLSAVHPDTGQPIQANAAFTLDDFTDANVRVMFHSNAMSEVRHIMTGIAKRIDKAGEWITSNQDRVDDAITNLQKSLDKFTDVDSLSKEVTAGVRELVGSVAALAGVSGRPGAIMQQLRALVGDAAIQNRALYETEIQSQMRSPDFYRNTFDLLDQAVADKVDFTKPVAEVQAQLRALNKTAYQTLVGDNTGSQARLATVVAYAKGHAWLLSRLELRGTDPSVRGEIVQKLHDELYKKPGLSAEVKSAAQAATLTERALSAFHVEQVKVLRDKAKLDNSYLVKNVGELVQQFYAQEENRLAGVIGAHDAVVAADGAEFDVPVQQPDGSWKWTKGTLNMSVQRQVTNPKEVQGWLSEMAGWLDQQDKANIRDGRYWQVKAQQQELLDHGVFSDAIHETNYRALGLWLGSLVDRMNALGTPAGRLVAQMINVYGSKKAFLATPGKNLGYAVERAQEAAMNILTPKGRNRETYRVNFYEPAVQYFGKRWDLLESGLTREQQLDQGWKDFGRWLSAQKDTDPRRAMMAGKEAQFLIALRKHIEAANEANKWQRENNIDDVSDPKLGGKSRQRYERGLYTFPYQLSKEFTVMWSAMANANWADILPSKNDSGATIKPGAWDADVLQNVWKTQGKDGVAKIVDPFFANERIQRIFLEELAMMEPSSVLPGMLNEDGTRTDLNPYLVQQAWRVADGKVLNFIEAVYQLHSGGEETIAEYTDQVLGEFRSYYRQIRRTQERHNPDATQTGYRLDRLVPAYMIHGRTIENWPALWRQSATFDHNSGNHAVDLIASQQAFGPEGVNLVAAFKTASDDLTADLMKLKNAEAVVTMEGQLSRSDFKKRMAELPEIGSMKEVNRLYRLKTMDYEKFTASFTEDLGKYFRKQSRLLPADYGLARQALMFVVRRMLEQPGTALTTIPDTFSPLRKFGVSLPIMLDVGHSLAWKVPRDLLGSLTQTVGIVLSVKNEFRKQFLGLGFKDPITEQNLGLKWRETGTNPMEGWQKKVSRGISKVDTIFGFGVNLAGKMATSPILRPLALFTQFGLTMNLANVEAMGNRVEKYLRQAMDYLKINPAAMQDPLFGVNTAEWADAVGFKGGKSTFLKVSDSMQVNYGLQFGRLVREAIERDAGGQYLMSNDTVSRIAGIALQELSLEPNIATMSPAAYNNAWARAQLPLMGWMVRQSFAVSRMGMDAEGRGTRWLQIPRNRQDLATTGRMLMAMSVLSGGALAAGMMIDWYNEYILGKRRNLRQVSTTNSTGENALAILEQVGRIGTGGFLLDAANTAVNMAGYGNTGDLRGISMDQRVVAMSSLMGLFRTINAFASQGANIDYSGVVRPAMMALGGNGALQYMQLANRFFGLDNAESRAVARTNSYNWLRVTGRALGMEIKPMSGGYNTPTPMTPFLSRMQLATYGNDRTDFMDAYREAITEARRIGKENPEDYVKRAFETRNPLVTVFRVRPSAGEYAQLLAAMPDSGRRDVSEAVTLFNRYATMIGASPFVGRQIKPNVSAQDVRRQIFGGFGGLAQPTRSTAWTMGLR